MAKAANFDLGSARRISRAVRKSENHPTDLTRKRRPSQILGGGALRRFELKDDLDEDNTPTDAYLLNYDSDADEYVIDEDTVFEVVSFTDWTGTGKDGETNGTRGWCTQKDGRWEVVGSGGFDRCKCLLKGAMETTDETHTVDNVTPISGSSPLDDPDSSSEELIVSNIDHSWEGDDNAVGRIEWNRTAERWELYQVTCPA